MQYFGLPDVVGLRQDPLSFNSTTSNYFTHFNKTEAIAMLR